MELIQMNKDLQAYLKESNVIDFSHPLIQEKVKEFTRLGKTKEEQAELAFNFARDEIKHSFDIDGTVVTTTASEAMEEKEGICFAKAHVLAALLRVMGIPTGFCYQRVTKKGTPEFGYALHGLNAIYSEDTNTWFRVDPRGNKPGISSEFNTHEEKLAYPIRLELDEIDYPYVYSEPLEEAIFSLENATDCKELYLHRPEEI